MPKKGEKKHKFKDSKDKEMTDGEYLTTYTRHLEKRLKNLETEKQLLDAERLRLEQELHSLRNEIDRLREPPLVAAVIVDILNETKGRALVMSSTGPAFAVNASRKVKNDKLEPGMLVLLNQRTFAIMEVLDTSIEKWDVANQMIYRGVHNQIYKSLEHNQEQILEQTTTNKKLFEALENIIKRFEQLKQD